MPGTSRLVRRCIGMLRWAAALVVATAMAACGSAPAPTAPTRTPAPTPPIAFGDPCAVITAAEVGAIIGTPVGAVEADGATCHFSTASTTAVGNYDPTMTP